MLWKLWSNTEISDSFADIDDFKSNVKWQEKLAVWFPRSVWAMAKKVREIEKVS